LFKAFLTGGPQGVFNEKSRRTATSDAAVAAYTGDFATAVDLVRTKNADPNYISSYWHGDRGVAVKMNVGLDAIRRNDQQALSDLIGLGLNPNLNLGYSFETPVGSLLMAAIREQNENAANLLIDKGASVTFDGGGQFKPPLELAKQHLPNLAGRIEGIIEARSQQPAAKAETLAK